MNIKIASFFNLDIDIIPQKNIRKYRFKIFPFIISELKIGDFFGATSGITFVKILSEPIPEITPKIKVDIRKISISELLDSKINNLDDFFPNTEELKTAICQDSMEYFIATRGNELVYTTSVGYVSRGRLMISGTKTLECFRGNHINPAALVHIMRYLRDKGKVDRVYVSTGGKNKNMQKSIFRAGFKIDAIFYSISLFKRHVRPIHFLKNLCNRLGAKFWKQDEA